MRNLFVLTAAAVCAVSAGCSSGTTTETKKAETSAAPVYFKVDAATAGSISGKVLFSGAKPAAKKIVINEEAECVKMNPNGLFVEDVSVNEGGTLANVFVYVKGGLEGKLFEPAAAPVTIDQKGCKFEPRVLAVQVGQPFQVTNSDPVTHNIHPMPKNNPEWNQGQAPGASPLERQFARPEILIPIKCNVHSWMRSYVAVLEHPYFAISGKDGSFEIRNLPPGDYTVEAWQEKLGAQELKVTVAPSGKGTAEFTFKGA